MNQLNAETQEDLKALLLLGWRFVGFAHYGWIGNCPGHNDVHGGTLELAIRAAMGAK